MRRTSRTSRNARIAAGVVLFHIALLWLLQNGLLPGPAVSIVPVTLYTSAPERPAAPARSAAPRHAPPRPAPPEPQPLPAPAPTPAPTPPAARPELEAVEPVPDAAAGVPEPQPPRPAPAPTLVPAQPPATTSPPPSVEPPDSSARYLNNPQPAYPALSQRLGEQGRIVVRVLIGADGRAQQAEILHSSGFARLDRAALHTVKNWRYLPGRRGGVPEAMWHNVPIVFILQ